ncbi:hypothetical protein SACS_1045 [Parasaccharibacter apium]|uniref:Uncharacterized protein n=1 Tax=Parasaccharibacter apium TaxID=1510841 RepID=A0A7U7G627_9PROT|nr:hypothetical protein SACS_1045 [Parasaccharibacter apium]
MSFLPILLLVTLYSVIGRADDSGPPFLMEVFPGENRVS